MTGRRRVQGRVLRGGTERGRSAGSLDIEDPGISDEKSGRGRGRRQSVLILESEGPRVAMKTQKAEIALTRKRVPGSPANRQDEFKRQKYLKELNFGLMPGVPETDAKRTLSFLPVERAALLPLVPGTPEVLPDPLPRPWLRSKTLTSSSSNASGRKPNPSGEGSSSVILSPEADLTIFSEDISDASARKPNPSEEESYTVIFSPEADLSIVSEDISDASASKPNPSGEQSYTIIYSPEADLLIVSEDISNASASKPNPSGEESYTVIFSPEADLSIVSEDIRKMGCAAEPMHHNAVLPRASTPLPCSQSEDDDPCALIVTPTLEEETDGMDAGSDIDEEDTQPNDLGVDYPIIRPSTLATDSSAVLPENLDPKLKNAIDQMDTVNDRVMHALLPADCVLFDWQSDLTLFTGVREEFTGTPGPTFPTSEMESPVHVFLKIWDQNIMESIVQETNDYASQCLNKPGIPTHSRLKRWHPTTVQDLFVMFSVMIHQSLTPCTVESEYFYPSCRMTAMPYFKEFISYNKLMLLKRFLHFSNNANIPQTTTLEKSRLFKIQPILDHLNQKFQALYLPKQNISIDESLLKWKGRLSFSQKISTKAAKVGIKSYELCESETGYLWKFKIYAGKGATSPTTEAGCPDKSGRPDESERPDVQTRLNESGCSDDSEPNGSGRPDESDRLNEEPAGATVKIVYDLARSLFHKGYTLVMDNLYNSPILARCLKLKGTDTFGTLRLHRNYVPSGLKALTKAQLKFGDVISSTSGDLNVLAWKDNNLVSMISTYHSVEIGAREKYGQWAFKPKVVLDYNKSMGGVDKKDQLLSNFPMERKRNSVWYKNEAFERFCDECLYHLPL